MKPSINIHVHGRLSHQLLWANSFAGGLKKHDISAQVFTGFDEPGECDLVVFWGHSYNKKALMDQQIRTGRHYLVMERGFYDDRFLHTSLGYDGLNGQACFLNHSSPPDRWESSRSTLKPWNPKGDYYLLIGQVQGDSSCKHANLKKWYDEVISRTQVPVMFRPHPLDLSRWMPNGSRQSSKSLEQDMAGAIAVITFSSTVGVDAMIAGKPTIAYDSFSMVYDLVPHRIQLTSLIEPDREQWAYDLAYTQWNKAEIESGKAWDHLRGMYGAN